MTPLELLVEELEETLYALGEVGLYEFATRAQTFAATPDDIGALCNNAFLSLNERFALHLEWYRWPPQSIGRAEPDTEVDFTFDHGGDVDVPYLVLVPDDANAVHSTLEQRYRPGSSR